MFKIFKCHPITDPRLRFGTKIYNAVLNDKVSARLYNNKEGFMFGVKLDMPDPGDRVCFEWQERIASGVIEEAHPVKGFGNFPFKIWMAKFWRNDK